MTAMRVSRRFLYWGVLLVTMGGVAVAADLGAVDGSTIEQALRLWPVAVIAIGVAIVARRTRFSMSAWLVAAALPGLLLGGALAIAPRIPFDCASGEPATFSTSHGAFERPAAIDVTTGCGSLSVTTAAGSGWRLEAGNTADAVADVTATGTSLTIGASRRGGWFGVGGRDVWRLSLPTSPIERLDLEVNAGDGDVDLAGAEIASLDLRTNGAHAVVDLSEASVGRLSAAVNAGELSIRLPAGQDLTGSLEVNLASLLVCAPSGLGVSIEQGDVLGSSTYRGLEQDGNVWRSPDYGQAAHRADLSVRVNLGSVEFNPIGGCQ
jgi:hypothetical protein